MNVHLSQAQKRAMRETAHKALTVLLTISMVMQTSPMQYAYALDGDAEPQVEVVQAEPEATSAETPAAPAETPAPDPEPAPAAEPEAAPAETPAATAEPEATPAETPAAEPEAAPQADAADAPTVDAPAEAPAATVDIAISASHASVTYGTQTVSAANGTLALPEGADARLTVTAQKGYSVTSVKATVDGKDAKLAAEADGSYTLPAASIKAGTKLTVATKADATAEKAPTKTVYTYKDNETNPTLTVTATLEKADAVPDEATLKVTRVTESSTKYNYAAYLEALNKDAGAPEDKPVYTAENTALYDVAFIMRDAKTGKTYEVQPKSGWVKVNFSFARQQLSEGLGLDDAADLQVVHLPLRDYVKADTTANATGIAAADVVVERVGGADLVTKGTDAFEAKVRSFSLFAVSNQPKAEEAAQAAEPANEPATDEAPAYSYEISKPTPLSAVLEVVGLGVSIDQVYSVETSADDLLNVEFDGADFMLTPVAAFDEPVELAIKLFDETVYTVSVTDGVTREAEPAEEPVGDPEPEAAPATKTVYFAETDDVRVVATLTDAAAIPDDAVLTVAPITRESEGYSYDAYLAALNQSAGREDAYTEDNTLIYDVAFIWTNEDGERVELQPANGTVQVSFRFKNNQLTEALGAKDASEINVIHLPLVDEVRDAVATTEEATNISAADIIVDAKDDARVSLDNGESSVFVTDNFSGVAFSVQPEEEQFDSKYTAVINFYDYDGETEASYQYTPTKGDAPENKIYVYAELKDSSGERIGWNVLDITPGSNANATVEFTTFGAVSNASSVDNSLTYDATQGHTVSIRLYRTAPTYHLVREDLSSWESRPDDTINGYKFMSNTTSGSTSTVSLKRWNGSHLYINFDFDEALTKAVTDADNYWVRVELKHQTTGSTFYVKKLSEIMAEAGKDSFVIEADVWRDSQNGTVQSHEKFTGNEPSVVVQLIHTSNSAGESNIVKLENMCEVIAEGGNMKNYAVSYDGENGEKIVKGNTIDNEEDYETDLYYTIEFEAINTTSALTPGDILGDAVEYGIVANRYDQFGHSETNMAVNYLFDTSNIDIDGSGLAAIPFYIANIVDQAETGKTGDSRLWISKGTSVPSDVFVGVNSQGKIEPEFSNQEISPAGVNVYPTSESTISAYVNSLISAGQVSSAALATQTTIAPVSTQQGYTVDTTAFPDNTTIYVNADGISEVIAKGGWQINKLPGQSIVFNISKTESKSGDGKVTIGEFYVNPNDGGSTVQSTTAALNADNAKNERVDDVIFQHISFNVTNATNVHLDNASGLFLLPSAMKVTQSNGAGWILAKGTIESHAEWHFYRHTRDYVAKGDIELAVQKSLVDGSGTTVPYENKNFRFALYNADESFNPTGDAIEIVRANATTGIASFKSLGWSETDVADGDTKQYRYVLVEVVPDDAVNAEGVAYKDATDEQKASSVFYKNGIQYTGATQRIPVVVTVKNTGSSEMAITVVANDKDVTGTNDVFPVGDFTNAVTGELTVKKTVHSSRLADMSKKFEFTVTLSDTSINGKYGDMTFENGVATFTLKNAASKTATGLPTGISYEVTEADQDDFAVSAEGADGTITHEESTASFINTYSNQGSLSVGKKVEGGTDEDEAKEFNFKVTLDKVNGTFGDATFNEGVATVTVNPGETKTVSGVADHIVYTIQSDPVITGDYGDLTFDGNGKCTYESTDGTIKLADELPTGSYAFKITLAITGTYGDLEFEDGVAEFTLKHGEVKMADGLPLGIGYKVEELNSTGYQVIKTGDTGNLAKASTATFTNTQQTTDVTVSKAWLNAGGSTTWPESVESVTVKLLADGADTGRTVTLSASKTSDTFSGLAKYQSDGTTEVAYSVEEAEVAGYTAAVSGTAAAGFTVTNTYTTSDQIVLTATKALSGRTLEDGTFSFTLTGNGQNQTKFNVGQSVTFDAIAFNQSNVGKSYTYTVKEVQPETIPAGYTYDQSEYEVTLTVGVGDDGKMTIDKSIKKVVDADGNAIDAADQVTIETMSFSNKYEAAGTAKFFAQKDLSGRELKDDEFSFTLTGDKVAGGSETKPNNGNRAVFTDVQFTQADLNSTATEGQLTYANGSAVPAGTKYGTFTFTINEVIPAEADKLPGVTYDTSTKTITVTAIDKGNGTIDIKYSGNSILSSGAAGVTFENAYTASGDVTFGGTKTLEGRDFKADDPWTFTITAKNGAPLKDAKGNAVSTATITKKTANTEDYSFSLHYTLADLLNADGKTYADSKTFEYTITENGTDSHVTNDSSASRDITITVTDKHNADGKLTVEVTKGASNLDFTNAYDATGQIDFGGTKVIEGRDFQAGDTWTFTIAATDGGKLPVDAEGNTISSVTIQPTSGSTSDIDFGTFKYTLDDLAGADSKTFTYTITESGTVTGVTNDAASTKTIQVKVTNEKKADGALKVELVEGKNEAVFTNTYDASGSTTFGGTKTLEGRTLNDKDQWSFALAPVDGAPLRDSETATTSLSGKTVKNNGGTYSFGTFYYKLSDLAITDADGNVTGYKDAETFSYTITESGSIDNVTNDSKATRTIKVTVTQEKDADGNLTGNLVVTPAEGTEDGNFVNAYTTSETAQFQVSKTLDGRDWADADSFGFTLTAVTEGAPMPEGTGNKATATKPETGKAATANFGAITFGMTDANADGSAKDYIYKITEDVPATKIAGVTYATDPVYVKVSVSYDKATGKLTVTGPAYFSDEACTKSVASAAFTNTYEAAGTITIKGVKSIDVGTQTDLSGFKFTLEGNGVKQAVTTNAKGEFQFDALSYEVGQDGVTANAAKTFTYKLTESPRDGYKTLDPITVTVTVTDDATGALTVTSDMPTAGYKLVNEHEATGSVTFEGTKTIDSRDLTADDVFTFEIVENDEVVATASNKADGTIEYPAITYALNATKGNADLGTHTYTVREAVKNGKGITTDTTQYTVTVEVEDQGTSELKVTPSGNYKSLDFANKYAATGTLTFDGIVKDLTGRDMTDADVFTFVIKDAKGTEVARGTNDKSGAVTFTPASITYTLDANNDETGTHSYTISEVVPAEADKLPGVDYSAKDITFDVTVTDKGDGTLNVTPDHTSTLPNVTMTNGYAASGELVLSGAKTITNKPAGMDLSGFKFTVKEGSTVVATGTSAADGTITFGAISYADLGAVGEHTYVVSEDADSKPGVTNSTATKTVKVNVTDDGAGNLVATATTDSPCAINAVNFTNSYAADGSVVLTAHKDLTGRTLAAGQFSFELRDATGTVLQTATNAADGSVTFETIAYDLADAGKSYSYVIAEVVPAGATDNGDGTFTKDGYTYDGHTESVTVAVTDNGQGGLTVTPTYASKGGASFSNTYAATGSVTFAGTKTIDTRDLTTADVFTFEIYEGKTLVASATNDATGKIGYPTLTYTLADAGTHTYKVSEATVNDKGIVSSAQVYTVKVTVTDNGDGTLAVVASPNPTALDFENAYTATGKANFFASKYVYVDGQRTLPADGAFSFTLSEGSGASATVLQTKTNNALGKVSFDEIEYTLADVGTHTYTLAEVVPADATTDAQGRVIKDGVQYDTKQVTVNVVVADNGDGTLSVTYNGQNSFAGVEFANQQREAGKVQVFAHKDYSGRTLEEGMFEFVLLDGEGAELQRVSNKADGSVTFESLAYTEADAGNVYHYTVREVLPEAATAENNYTVDGISYDATAYAITVTVNHGEGGELDIDADMPELPFVFANAYEATGSVQFGATKTLSGRDLAEGEFAFELLDAEGVQLQTATNAADGTVEFASISYTIDEDAQTTYEYTVREVVPADAVDADGVTYAEALAAAAEAGEALTGTFVRDAITYDATEHSVVVELNEDAGVVSASVTVDGEAVAAGEDGIVQVGDFANKYFAAETVAAFDKYYYGGDEVQTFTFTVKAADETGAARSADMVDLGTKTAEDSVADSGTGFSFDIVAQIGAGANEVVLPKMTYAKPGTYYYAITEAEAAQVSTDKATILVKAEVAWNEEGTEAAEPVVTYQVVEGNGVSVREDFSDVRPALYNNGALLLGMRRSALTNANAVAEVTYFMPEIRKVMENGVLAEGEFAFELLNADGVRVGEVVTNDADGNVSFPAIEYTEPGTYSYTIREIAGSNEAIVYSDTEIALTVTVTEKSVSGDSLGKLEAVGVYAYDDAFGSHTYNADTAEGEFPTIINQYDTIRIHALKTTREYDENGNIYAGAGLEHAHYGLWMVNPNGGSDVYMGLGRNQPEKEGALLESTSAGYSDGTYEGAGHLWYDIPTLEGVAYYFLEEEPAPAGHLVDPYRTDYFTLVAEKDADGVITGFHLAYENSAEFAAACPDVNPHR